MKLAFRFRLRTLLLVTAVIAAGLGGLEAVRARRADEQRTLTEIVERYGGAVGWDFRGPGFFTRICPERYEPLILEVRRIHADATYLRRGDVERLLSLDAVRSVQVLYLRRADLHGELPGDNCQLSELQLLDLSATTVGDATIEKLTCLPKLECLWLAGTHVTDRGCRSLAELPALQGLDVAHTRITGEGIKDLTDSMLLNYLDVSSTEIGDDDLQVFADFPNLQCLTLTGTRVTAKGLRTLREVKLLTTLELKGVEIAEADLMMLADFPALKVVYLDRGGHDAELRARVTAELRKLRPQLRLVW